MIRANILRAFVLVATAFAGAPDASDSAAHKTTFTAPHAAEATAIITVRCHRCRWDVEGREAVMLALTLDGRYSQHLPILRGGRAEYAVMLGAVAAGSHTLFIAPDPELTARELRGIGAAVVETVRIEQVAEDTPEHAALSLAPLVYARPNTVGRFSDVPVFMWYEREPGGVGPRYRYSVIFTNEDGGTPADRLMATWGRTTDIEYVYSVVLDAAGNIVVDDIQGPEHEILPFRGRREGRHPLLWVVTDNNMVLGEGTTAIRYAPAPVAFPLRDVSREEVMDAHPWLYAVMAQELARERKIVADAPPRTGTIPDPRRFVYLEACGEAGDVALAFAVRAGDEWIPSDRGVPEYRIVRSGCFRAAVPLPRATGIEDVRALRVQAFERQGRSGATPARLTRINRLFTLDEQFAPGRPLLTWRGSAELRAGGPPLELSLQ